MLEQYVYGTAGIFFVPLGVAVAQPIRIGTTQDVSVDMEWSEKPLQGRLDAPAAIARGALKVGGKIKSAKFSIKDSTRAILGAASSVGTTVVAENEGAPTGTAIPAATVLSTNASTASGAVLPFASTAGVAAGQAVSGLNIPVGTTVVSIVANTSVTLSASISSTVPSGTAITFGSPTITVINAATFVDDGGVVNMVTGQQLSRVASAPASGQYTVSAGVYTFSGADAGLFVAPTYSWTQTAAGQGFTYYAQQMGPRPTFKMVLSKPVFMNNPAYTAQPLSLVLWSAGLSKFSLDFKNEDWTIPEQDFSCSQDFLGRVFTWGADQ